MPLRASEVTLYFANWNPKIDALENFVSVRRCLPSQININSFAIFVTVLYGNDSSIQGTSQE